MTSSFVQVRNKIEGEIETAAHDLVSALSPEISLAENFLKNLAETLKPVAESDLKAIAVAGISAGAAALTGGTSLTLSAAEAAAVIGGRAILAAAKTAGAQIGEQAALALGAAVGVPSPATQNGANH